MLLELMSNGTLAELPPDNAPDGIAMPDEHSVMLLLPHNKYLLGTEQKGSDRWIFASATDKPDTPPKKVFLYDDEILSLTNEDAQPTIIPARIVTELRRELFMLTAPPGRHSATVLLMRTFMRSHPALRSDDASFLDEKIFSRAMKEDYVLCRVYWTLRFALSRGEMETVARIKSWLKIDPDIFSRPEYSSRIWFSLTGLPDEKAVHELEELSFSALELQRMVRQDISPLLVYNPSSGWLVLGRFGHNVNTMFFVWAYFNHDLWAELRDKKKLPVKDILQALWCEQDMNQAMNERAKYRGDDICS